MGVFRYDDVLRVLNTPSVFSSDLFAAMPQRTPITSSIIFTDPPRHKQIRSLVTQAFSPKTLSGFEPRIAAIVDGLLDHVLPAGAMDVITDVAYPVPMTVIAELLGVSPDDHADFQRWSAAFISDEAGAAQAPDVPELDDYVRRMIQQRTTDPRDDVISTLVHARVEEKALTADEILGFCELLLVAGYETTAHLLCNAFRCFDEHPEVMDRLRADPALIPAMIEETLRFRSPALLQFRVAAADTVLQGQQIRAGQLVIPWLGSANRDERQFPDPDCFDIDRSPNRHVAFGHGGIHFCLGAPLARLEGRIARSLALQRLEDIRCDCGVPLEAMSSLISGVKHLPITFRARR